MLGSHNTLTAYPCPWYLKPFGIFSKCQSKSVAGQLNSGVRFFDLRIKVRPDGGYCAAHGLMRYKTKGLLYLMEVLSDYAQRNSCDIYYRVMLEYNRKPKGCEKITSEFKDIVKELRCRGVFSGVHEPPRFCGAYQKWDYACVVEPEYDLPLTHRYSSVLGWKRFIHCVPYLYAKMRNKKFREECKDILSSDNAVLLLDFV